MNNSQKRFREYGLTVGFLAPGPTNTITDVGTVLVGHFSKIIPPTLCTGVTIIDPGINNLYGTKLPAAIAIGNGTGKTAGISQVEELGTLEAPIALTNTLAVGPVTRGIIDIVLAENTLQPRESINVIVGETNDGLLSTLHADAVTKDDVLSAYKAKSKSFALGCVGAGAGTRAFSWKGGIGSASRTFKISGTKYTLGALVQTNYGGMLNILGIPIGVMLGKTDFDDLREKAGDGSCMIVLATDAPLTSRQLKRVARRAFLALGKTGSVMNYASGDYAIAFSTNPAGVEGENAKPTVPDNLLTSFFIAAVETVEESVYDALFCAQTTVGRDGNKLEAIPVPQVVEILKRYDPTKS